MPGGVTQDTVLWPFPLKSLQGSETELSPCRWADVGCFCEGRWVGKEGVGAVPEP